MKQLMIGALCAVLGSALSSSIAHAADMSDKNPGSFSKSDYRFVCEAASGGMMEVQAGELAKNHGASESVKQFGDRMVTDHSQANDELKSLAQRKGASLPTTIPAKEQHSLDKLSSLSGPEFDRAYAKDMVTDHKKDVKAFQKEAQKADDPDLRAFAAKTAPTLEEHLQMATNMMASVKMK